MRLTRADALAIATLVLAVLARWSRVLPGLGEWHFEDGDFVDQFYAFARFEVAEIAAGRWPLWNPHAYAGSPFWADIQAAVAYPSSLIVSLAAAWTGGDLPIRALELEAVAHVLLAALGTYVFARHVLCRRAPSLIAALAFGLGGWMNGYPMLQLAVLEAAAWLPWALWGVARTIERPRDWPLPALALGLCVLAGHPQTTLYVGYTTVAWALWRLWRVHREQTAPASLALRPHLLALAAAVVGALGLSAAGWLPAAGFLRLSNRADAGYDLLAHGFPTAELLGVLLTDITKWAPLSIGLAPLFLAALAAWWVLFGHPESWKGNRETGPSRITIPRPPRDGLFWIGLAGAALLLSLGRNGILFDLAYHLAPGFDLFRGQERAAMLVSFALAMLAGVGGQLWLDVWSLSSAIYGPHLPDGAKRKPLPEALGIAALAWLKRYVYVGAWILGGLLAMGMLLIVTDMQQGLRDPLAWWIEDGWYMLLLFLWLLPHAARSPKDMRAHFVLPLFVLLSLLVEALGVTTNLSRTPPLELTRTPAQMILHQAGVEGRVHDHADRGERRWPPNAGMLHGYASLDGASPLRLRTFQDLRSATHSDERLLWQLLAVSHVVSSREAIDGATPLMTLEGGDTLHALDAPWPRAWRAPAAERVDDTAATARMADPGWDPMAIVLLAAEAGTEGAGDGGPDSAEAGAADAGDGGPDGADALDPAPSLAEPDLAVQSTLISVALPAPGEVLVTTEGPTPAWIVISEIYDPAWRATVDGREALVRRANLGLMAVEIPAGSHQIVLRYQPRTVPIGIGLSLLSALLLAGAWTRGRGRREPPTGKAVAAA